MQGGVDTAGADLEQQQKQQWQPHEQCLTAAAKQTAAVLAYKHAWMQTTALCACQSAVQDVVVPPCKLKAYNQWYCCPAGCMEAGYMDFQQVRTDPDLDFLRADSRFEVRTLASLQVQSWALCRRF